jgi:transcriptional regulator with XRE-family HTH domain
LLINKGTPWNKKLAIRRVALDLTQQQAADLIGVPIGTYGRWERGSHAPMKVYKVLISQAFQIDEAELFG